MFSGCVRLLNIKQGEINNCVWNSNVIAQSQASDIIIANTINDNATITISNTFFNDTAPNIYCESNSNYTNLVMYSNLFVENSTMYEKAIQIPVSSSFEFHCFLSDLILILFTVDFIVLPIVIQKRRFVWGSMNIHSKVILIKYPIYTYS